MNIPHSTQVPDEFFDELLPTLPDAPLRVLLYLIRRTFGFRKNGDHISLSQFVYGIKGCDKGCGLKRRSVISSLQWLEAHGYITRSATPGRGHVTYYRLILRDEKVHETHPLPQEKVHEATQEKVHHGAPTTYSNRSQDTERIGETKKVSPTHALIETLRQIDPNQAINYGQVGSLLKHRLAIDGMTPERIVSLYRLYMEGGWWGSAQDIGHFLSTKIFNSLLVRECEGEITRREREWAQAKAKEAAEVTALMGGYDGETAERETHRRRTIERHG